MITFLCLVVMTSLMSCDQSGKAPSSSSASAKTAQDDALDKGTYLYSTPDQVMVLDRNLREISSLAYMPDSNYLVTNDDESGFFFFLNATDGKTIKKTQFAKPGDYEAVAIVDHKIIVAKNTGTLFMYDQLTKQTDKDNNAFKASNDIEGLCLTPDKSKLLIACKGQPLGIEKGKKNKKALYHYDLASKTLDTIPMASIIDDDLVAIVQKEHNLSSKAALRGKVKRIKEFSPSGVAIHPTTNDIYVISAKGSTLLRLDRNGVPVEIGFFNDNVLPQPEGITFDGDANLYVSGEGKSGSGKIFRWNKN